MLLSDYKNCTKCDVSRNRNCVILSTDSKYSDIVILSESPSYQDDKTGINFNNKSAAYLRLLLTQVGFNLSNIYFTYSVKCKVPNHRKPTIVELRNCSELLNIELETLKPKVIILLGRVAHNAIFNKEPMISFNKNKVFITKKGTYIFTIYHPMYIINNPHLHSLYYKFFEKVYNIYTTKINTDYEYLKTLWK